MPWQPLRRCTEPGCNRRVKSGKCEEHRRAAWRAEDARRGHRRARGYSRQWDKYRALYLKKIRYVCVVWLRVFIRQPLWWITLSPSMAVVMFSSGLSGTIRHCARRATTVRRHGKIQPRKRTVRRACIASRKNGRHIVTTGCMAMMTEQEQNRLIRGLIRQRDLWKTQETGHKANRTGRIERTTAKRLTDRDREVMECFRNRW